MITIILSIFLGMYIAQEYNVPNIWVNMVILIEKFKKKEEKKSWFSLTDLQSKLINKFY